MKLQHTMFTVFGIALMGLAVMPMLNVHRSYPQRYPWQSTSPGIQHIKATETMVYYKDGSTTSSTETRAVEFWYDPNTQRAQYEELDANGNVERIDVRNGLTDVTYNPQNDTTNIEVATSSDVSFLDEVRQEMLHYQDTIQSQPALTTMETTTYNNENTYVLQGPTSPSSTSDGTTMQAYISQQTGLPLKEVLYQPNDTGGQTAVETAQYQYSTNAFIDPSQVPSDVFSTSFPSTGFTEKQTYMVSATASSFSGFTLYWLGPAYGDIPLFAIDQQQEASGADNHNSVDVTYAYPFVNGTQKSTTQVSITQSPPLPAGTMIDSNSDEGTDQGESVMVNGHQATLYDDPGDQVALTFTIGGTFITINGDSRDQVLDAASRLRKLSS